MSFNWRCGVIRLLKPKPGNEQKHKMDSLLRHIANAMLAAALLFKHVPYQVSQSFYSSPALLQKIRGQEF